MTLEGILLVKKSSLELLLSCLYVLTKSSRDFLHDIKDSLLIATLFTQSLLAVIFELEKLGYVLLQARDLLLDVGYSLVHYIQGAHIVATILDLDLN